MYLGSAIVYLFFLVYSVLNSERNDYEWGIARLITHSWDPHRSLLRIRYLRAHLQWSDLFWFE